MRCGAPISATSGWSCRNLDEFLHQLASGLALGGVYAIMALALVMIYQATQLVNFAQGEMAMFSTYFAWKLIDLGWPYWLAFVATVARCRSSAGSLIERLDRAAIRQRAGSRLRDRVHRPRAHLQLARRMALRLFGPVVRQPFTSKPWFGAATCRPMNSGSIARDPGRAGAGLRVFPLHPARPRDAGGGAESGVEPAGRHPGRLDAGDRLGPGGGDRRRSPA